MAGDPLVTAAIVAQTAELATWHGYNVAEDIAVNIAAGVQIALQTTQMVTYYAAADDAIDERDDRIDDQLDFMQTLQDLKYTQDLPMILCKKAVLTDLNLPTVDRCSSVVDIAVDGRHEGYAVIEKSDQYLGETCDGLPSGWKNHEGLLQSSKSSAYNGGILANSEQRRVEQFRSRKTRLVSSAQAGMKSIFNAGEILNKYAQAAAVHSGLADLYIQGFNSAGAALGTSLGRLSSGTQTTTTQSIDSGASAGAASGVGAAAASAFGGSGD